MGANFIPPIDLGQFKPSSTAIASWLYEIWKYLQENPIPAASDVTSEAERVAQNYVTVNVPPMIQNAINTLGYAGFVDGTSLPIYRASNDEIDAQDLLEAWDEGCRFALVDDESFFVMIKTGDTIDLLQILTEQQSTGVISVNGKTGVVVLEMSDINNDTGFITESDIPVLSVNGQTGEVVIPNATTSASGLMSAADKTKLNSLVLSNIRVGSVVVPNISGNGPWGMSASLNSGETFLCWVNVASGGWVGAPFISDAENSYTTVYSSVAASGDSPYLTGTFLAATRLS